MTAGPPPEEPEIYGLEPELELPKPTHRPPPARSETAPIPCPHCGYDLQGLFVPQCPECGGKVQPGRALRTAPPPPTSLADRPNLYAGLLLAGGFLASVLIFILTSEVSDVSLLTVGLAVGIQAAMLLIACLVYFGCAMVWIGWASHVSTTMLQVAAAYSLAAVASMLLGLIPVPFLPWLISVVILIGLLMSLVDLDLEEAVIVALLVFLVRAAIWAWIFVRFVM
ncbi:MAG: hypothetical protein KF866_08305 [Phycisphaeraceae bacterium]|nr:hypothetical protein [Phycisphaeraceae bacterium]MCW5753878.1 hypothetical protein [Phycisphaeraceae bacterium]